MIVPVCVVVMVYCYCVVISYRCQPEHLDFCDDLEVGWSETHPYLRAVCMWEMWVSAELMLK